MSQISREDTRTSGSSKDVVNLGEMEGKQRVMEASGWTGPEDRMPEAEVSIRLAEYLSELPSFDGHVDVAIDGASVIVHGAEVFDIRGYLRAYGWQICEQDGKSRNEWAATYQRRGATMRIHSRSGLGDVEAVVGGRRIIAECKKGPLIKKPGSPEYPLLTTALGQALLFRAGDDDKRWCRFLRQGPKVDLPMKRTIQHEDTQTVYGRVQGQGRA